MELTAGYPFFFFYDGLPFAYPKLSTHSTSRVAIIGGGISGALTAYFLTEAGVECILLDGRTIGLGSTCASTSLLQYELDKPLHQLIEQVGENKAIRAYQLCGESITTLTDIMKSIGFEEFEMRKSLFYTSHASDLSFMKSELEARENAGFEVSLLTGKDMLEEYGMKAEYGILSEIGATINAYTLTHALLQYCIGKGMRVYDRSSVADIKYKSSGVELKTAEPLLYICIGVRK